MLGKTRDKLEKSKRYKENHFFSISLLAPKKKLYICVLFHTLWKLLKDQFVSVAKTMFENLEVLAAMLEPITIGTMGTQKPYRFSFEQYVQEARTKMPTRKAAGKK